MWKKMCCRVLYFSPVSPFDTQTYKTCKYTNHLYITNKTRNNVQYHWVFSTRTALWYTALLTWLDSSLLQRKCRESARKKKKKKNYTCFLRKVTENLSSCGLHDVRYHLCLSIASKCLCTLNWDRTKYFNTEKITHFTCHWGHSVLLG